MIRINKFFNDICSHVKGMFYAEDGERTLVLNLLGISLGFIGIIGNLGLCFSEWEGTALWKTVLAILGLLIPVLLSTKSACVRLKKIKMLWIYWLGFALYLLYLIFLTRLK